MSSNRDDMLYQLERETNLKTLAPQMISGHLQGLFFEMLVQLLQPRYAIEVGTFTGYATLSLAKGIKENGKLITIEVKPELEAIYSKYFKASPNADKIEAIIGDAKSIIPRLDYQFDLAYIDANKKENLLYFDMLFYKMNSNGCILVDNVLWNGKVVDKNKDRDTLMIHEFNQKIKEDPRVESVILPLRDGLMMIRIL